MISNACGRGAARILPAALLFSLAACGGGDGGGPPTGSNPVTQVTVTAPSPSLAAGGTLQLTATPRDASGNTVPQFVVWSSSAEAVATVSASGLVTGVSAGPVTIRAVAGTVTGTIDLTVTPVPVASVTVVPDAFQLQVGQTREIAATTRDAAGGALTGRAVAWTALDAGVATVTAAGVVQAVSVGQGRIVATVEGKADTATVTVVPVPVGAVTIVPDAFQLQVGQTREIAATARDANGGVLTGRAVAWSALDAGVATVTAAGVVQAVSVGQGRIVATVEGKADTATVTVVPVPVASVVIVPDAFQLQVGQSREIAATARDVVFNPLTGRAVAWTALDPAVATVSAAGVVQAVSVGQGRIVATVEGKTDTAVVTVIPIPVASVSIVPDAFQLQVAGTRQLAATARDAAGGVLTGRAVAWTALDAAVATVSAGGEVRGVSAGQARVVATVEGKADTALVTVLVPVAARVEVTPRFAQAEVGQVVALDAAAFTAAGERVLAPAVTWSAPGAAISVGPGGATVSGPAPGIYRVTAAVNAARDTATLAVLGASSILSTAFARDAILADAAPGELVSVPVVLDLSRVSSTGDLGALQLEVAFDPAVLAYESFAPGARGALDVFSPAAGRVRVAFAETAPQGTGRFTVLTLRFRVSASAAAGARSALALTYRAPTSTAFAPYALPIAVGGTVRVVP